MDVSSFTSLDVNELMVVLCQRHHNALIRSPGHTSISITNINNNNNNNNTILYSQLQVYNDTCIAISTRLN